MILTVWLGKTVIQKSKLETVSSLYHLGAFLRIYFVGVHNYTDKIATRKEN